MVSLLLIHLLEFMVNYDFDLLFNPTAGTSLLPYDVRVTETNTGTV